MIPVEAQPEPADFVDKVKKAGLQFLAQVSQPTAQQWKGREYWQRVLPEMRKAYVGICAYSAHWIPYSTGNHSIDHFVPKAQQPNLAYEWTNYRYVSARFNSRKGTRAIIDPFTLRPDWFMIDFNSFLIYPNPALLAEEKAQVYETINCLKLNADDDLVTERQAWFTDYLDGSIPFTHLQKHAPFIAYDIQRQGIELR